MQTIKTIAIIGASGNMGSALAKSLAKGPYRLLLMGRNTEKLNALSDAIKSSDQHADMEVIACAKEACWEADIIIAATPYGTEKEIAGKIKEVATGKIVVSIANPTKENSTSAAEELQKLLPYSKIIKAFNTVPAVHFTQPVIYDETLDCFIAGNDGEALETVSELVKTAGLNPVIAGPLV